MSEEAFVPRSTDREPQDSELETEAERCWSKDRFYFDEPQVDASETAINDVVSPKKPTKFPPRHAGFEAYCEGEPVSSNPYAGVRGQEKEAELWEAGFIAAMDAEEDDEDA